MPAFTINIPAGEGARVMNALCALEELPPTQANALQVLRGYVVRVVQAYERTASVEAAVAAVGEPTPVNPT